MDKIIIDENLQIPWQEIEISHARSGGPGGQNVNKVNSKVFMRWNLLNSEVLSEEQRLRIEQSCASYLTKESEILLYSESSRRQRQNLEDCIERLKKLLRQALKPKRKKRRDTQVPKSAKEKRLRSKKKRSQKKAMRSKVSY